MEEEEGERKGKKGTGKGGERMIKGESKKRGVGKQKWIREGRKFGGGRDDRG